MPRGRVRAEAIKSERQLPGNFVQQAPGRAPDSTNSRESSRRHFSIDCSGLGEGPATKAAAAAEPGVGVCALVSKAQAEASTVAGTRAAERMTAAALLS